MLIVKLFISGLITIALIFGLLFATSFTPISVMDSAYADPPAWAPAHGRKDKKYKHHKKNRSYYDDSAEVELDVRVPTHIENGKCNRETIGNVIGGIVGGIAGNQVGGGDGKKLATVVGAIAGWFVGGSIGRSMDDADRYCTGQALSHAGDGETVEWRNPDDDVDYKITPTKTIKSENKYCREYTTETTIGGDKQKTYGTACRQADGSWKIEG